MVHDYPCLAWPSDSIVDTVKQGGNRGKYQLHQNTCRVLTDRTASFSTLARHCGGSSLGSSSGNLALVSTSLTCSLNKDIIALCRLPQLVFCLHLDPDSGKWCPIATHSCLPFVYRRDPQSSNPFRAGYHTGNLQTLGRIAQEREECRIEANIELTCSRSVDPRTEL